ncbi:hypothetical protein CYMTET_47715 [Cymbomonas tetramitiformis]|uniref:Transmembrane protein n=1 Tax=Cymbomonas tetramitiformis TaxID=36881 RepID=A0AAE0EVT8_9CHLO|nr:hypothetical protein CYMTET_47715 [Cymbomonas tetramitiformis]|eukprot:gene590-993_t
MYTIKSAGSNIKRSINAGNAPGESYVNFEPEDALRAPLRTRMDDDERNERFEQDYLALSVRRATKAMDRKLCVILTMVCVFVVCNTVTLLIAGMAVMKYENVVNVYIQNLTSPDDPRAPFSAPRLQRAGLKVENMLTVANVAAQVISNESTFPVDSTEPIDAVAVARRKGIEARLSRLNETLATAERMAEFASGPHVTALMDTTASFLADTLSQIDMASVNTMIATFGNDAYLNHTLTLADKAMEKVDAYETTARRMTLIAAKAWMQNQQPNIQEQAYPYGYIPSRGRIAERHADVYADV